MVEAVRKKRFEEELAELPKIRLYDPLPAIRVDKPAEKLAPLPKIRLDAVVPQKTLLNREFEKRNRDPLPAIRVDEPKRDLGPLPSIRVGETLTRDVLQKEVPYGVTNKVFSLVIDENKTGFDEYMKSAKELKKYDLSQKDLDALWKELHQKPLIPRVPPIRLE